MEELTEQARELTALITEMQAEGGGAPTAGAPRRATVGRKASAALGSARRPKALA